MRLYTWPLDADDSRMCPPCAIGFTESTEAQWLEEEPLLQCQTCGGIVHVEPHDLPNPPTEPRAATRAEERAIGFGCEGDDQCGYCELWSMDGEYPVCQKCEACTECGCKCGEVAHE